MNVINFVFPRSDHTGLMAILFLGGLITISAVTMHVHGAPEREKDSDGGPVEDFLCPEIVTQC